MSTEHDLERLLDSRAVAEYLGISQSTISRMRRERTGPHFIEIRGRKFRYRLTELKSWLERQERLSGAA